MRMQHRISRTSPCTFHRWFLQRRRRRRRCRSCLSGHFGSFRVIAASSCCPPSRDSKWTTSLCHVSSLVNSSKPLMDFPIRRYRQGRREPQPIATSINVNVVIFHHKQDLLIVPSMPVHSLLCLKSTNTFALISGYSNSGDCGYCRKSRSGQSSKRESHLKLESSPSITNIHVNRCGRPAQRQLPRRTRP